MRLFEILFIIVNIFMFSWILFAKRKPVPRLVIGFGVSAIFMLLHAIMEGLRWQMLPTYVITVIPLVLVAVKRMSKRQDVKWETKKTSRLHFIMVTALGVIYSVIAVTLPLVLPVFIFEEPTGPYKIGTVTYDWKDNQREEVLTSDPNDKRRLMVQIWYPTDAEVKGDAVPYLAYPDVLADGYSKLLHMPKLLFTNFAYVKTHAMKHVALSEQEKTYPVLIFSHGFSGHKNQNTFQVEHLVSQGYIVVAIDHTYSSTASVFSDGYVANYVPQDTNSIAYLDKANEGWVADAKFVLDQVEELAENDPDNRFTNRMDMNNIGMFGHSFGGATSAQMLMTDARIKAAINMDGVLYGKNRIPKEGMDKPFMMMSADDSIREVKSTDSEEYAKFMEATFPRYQHVAAGGNYWMKIKHMDHMGFSDLYLLSPMFEKMTGVDVRKAHRLINEYTEDFFDHYLKQLPSKRLEQNIGKQSGFTLLQEK